MTRWISCCVAALVAAFTAVAAAEPRTIWLDDLNLGMIKQGWGKAEAKTSVQGRPLRLQGKTFARGVGSHAAGTFYAELDGNAKRFQATVGVDDDSNGPGSIGVKILGDGKVLFKSPVLRTGGMPSVIDLDLSGVKLLTVKMDDGGDNNAFDHVDWCDAKFIVEDADPKLVPRSYPPEEKDRKSVV